jgi:outer membrane protein assembly factor BamE (lipoprotein component of BamABCDE complex)
MKFVFKDLLMQRLIISVIFLALLGGCVQFSNKRGVEVAWQSKVVSEMKSGTTTRADVLDALGPPSQVISLEEETVMYYLFEKAKGKGLLLGVYNTIDIDTRYDRAIFFFDGNDMLTDFSTRIHEDDGD